MPPSSGPIRSVVLGATGFIGRWVARVLSERGDASWLVARDPDRARSLLPEYGAAGQVVGLDVLQTADLARLLRDTRPHVVYNLCGYGVDRGERDPAIATAVNTELVRSLVALIPERREQSWGGLALIHAGSALEYGEIDGDLDEDTAPNPTTLYGRTKLAGSDAIRDAASRGSIRATVARLFTVYGPGEHDGRLLPTLMAATKDRLRIPLSRGDQLRDFTYVGDVAEGLHRLARCPSGVPAVLNFATGTLISVSDFVGEASAILGIDRNRLGFGDLPARPEEMRHSPVTVDRLERVLGWRPRTTPAQGIRLTAHFSGDVDLPHHRA